MHVDPINYIIAVVGIIIVFASLTLLYVIFFNIPRVMRYYSQIKNRKKGTVPQEECCDFISGEENAAIAAAIYLYLNDLHDKESTKLTIKQVNKTYSPWSSKIHGLNILNR